MSTLGACLAHLTPLSNTVKPHFPILFTSNKTPKSPSSQSSVFTQLRTLCLTIQHHPGHLIYLSIPAFDEPRKMIQNPRLIVESIVNHHHSDRIHLKEYEKGNGKSREPGMATTAPSTPKLLVPSRNSASLDQPSFLYSRFDMTATYRYTSPSAVNYPLINLKIETTICGQKVKVSSTSTSTPLLNILAFETGKQPEGRKYRSSKRSKISPSKLVLSQSTFACRLSCSVIFCHAHSLSYFWNL